ncbi:MAG TPA: hypothetical protein VFY45_25985 [Baekduia sp.]|nr:hypothetical protein [Baekduia sp.]
MSSTDAPNWWADVQQEREDLAGSSRRPADDWLGEDIDFVPRRRIGRAAATAIEEPAAPRFTADRDGSAHPLHGVFVPTAAHAPLSEGVGVPRRKGAAAPVRESVATSRTIELTTGDDPAGATPAADMAHELAHLSAADDPFATPPPPAGTRRTVQIKGRPTESRMPSMAQRHRGRTASDRIGARPDRIALWAVALGAILILLAAMTSSSQAAVARHAATAPAVSAHVVHATTHHAPLRVTARD